MYQHYSQHGDSETHSNAGPGRSRPMDILLISNIWADKVPQGSRGYPQEYGQRSQLRSYALNYPFPRNNSANWDAVTGEPEGVLWRAEKGYGLGAEGTNRINATLLSLVRNEEVEGMVQAMRDLERTWNSKFNYPWTFFNDVPFTEDFKKRTQAETKAECIYGRRRGRLDQ